MNPYYTKCRSMMAFVLVAGVLLLVCGYAPAQQTEDPASPEEATADAGAEESETVVVNLNNVKIDHVIKYLSEITGLPVIKQKDVQVQLTVVSPAEVSRDRAFALVTEALLLEKVAVVRNQDSIRIIPVDLLSDVVVDLLPSDADGMTGGIVRVMIPVAFADVAEIEKVVKGLLSKTGSLVADPSSKQIMVTDSVRRINSIRDVVKQLDVLNTDKRQTQVFKLKHADAKELAPILKSVLSVLAAKTNGQAALTPQQQQQQQQRGQSQQQQQQQQQQPQQPGFYSWLYGSRNNQEDRRLISNLIGQVRVVPDIRTNSLMISTAPQNYQLLRNLISELDIPSPKVLVRVRLIEVTTTDASRIGTRFTSDTSILEADDFDNGLLASFGGIWADANSSGTIQGSANVDIGVLIQFLRRK